MSDSEQKIRDQFGDVSLQSAPVNAENPGFDSLLSALEAVHTGKEDRSLLNRYYEVLKAQNNESKADLTAMKTEENKDMINIAMTSLDLVDIMLDTIPEYLTEPTDENMAKTVSLLLTTMNQVEAVKAML